MKRTFLLAALLAATAVPAMTASAAEVQATPAIAKASVSAPIRTVAMQDWRYKWHNGQWWYYTPGNYWMTHNGTSWSRYNAGAVVAPRAGVSIGPNGVNALVNPRVQTYYRGNPYYNNYNRGYGNYYNRGYGNYYNRGYYNRGYNNRPYIYARPGIGIRL